MTNTPHDPSILGITRAELAELDSEEIHERIVQEVNRAADILEHVGIAFDAHLTDDEKFLLRGMSNMAVRLARKLDE